MVAENMNEQYNRTRRFSLVPSTQTIPEETTSNATISTLVVTNPVVNLDNATPEAMRPPPADHRQRRRSSVSILNTIADVKHSLPIKDARKRNMVVDCARPVHENDANDLHACFPNGRSLTVMITTWNTAETKKLYELNYTPTARAAAKLREEMHEDLADILLPTCIDYVADLIVVNTQETAPAKEGMDWEILMQEVIGPTHVLYHSVHHGSLSLCVFIRRDLIWFCSKPEDDVVRFRMLDPLRTKASVIVCFNLFGTSIMLINSHFQDGHHTEGRMNRDSNFRQTISRCSIPKEYIKRRTFHVNSDHPMKEKVESMKSTDSAPPGDLPPHETSIDATKSCDCVFWAGDFNFRVSMEHKDVLEHIKQSKFAEIVEKDEFHLLQEQKREPYINFKEGRINFPPTYKFDLTANSDSETYVQKRVPAYTDRVLYREKIGSSIECTKYESVRSVKHSDHKPVLAHFRIKLKPGSSPGNQGYGRFNQSVYRHGCQQREKHNSFGVGVAPSTQKSGVCTIL